MKKNIFYTKMQLAGLQYSEIRKLELYGGECFEDAHGFKAYVGDPMIFDFLLNQILDCITVEDFNRIFSNIIDRNISKLEFDRILQSF